MITKIISTVLTLFVIYMGVKQGWAMLSGKADMLQMFGKWGFSKLGVSINGAITIFATLLILFPKTFVWGNFLMATGILMIICFQLTNKDIKAASVELPFLCLNLALIYLQHPLNQLDL